MSKGHRLATKRDFERYLSTFRTMNKQRARRVRQHPLYAEMVRLYGIEFTEGLILLCPHTVREGRYALSPPPPLL